jgi:hypothetical protein
MYGVLAIHHPSPDHFNEAMGTLESILDDMQGTAGLTAGYVGHNPSRTDVIAFTFWEEARHFHAAFPAIQAAITRSGIHDWRVQPAQAQRFFLEMDAS